MHNITRITTSACAALALAMPTTVLAQRRGEPQLQVSYPTDGSLTCDQLTVEITRMEEIAGISAQNARNAENQGAIANGATSVAVNAALYSGALGAVPGLGLFANAAGAAARRNAEARARAEAERIRIAEQRRSLLSGIYQGRQCGIPVAPSPEAVAAAPAGASAEPAPAPVESAPAIETPASAPVPAAGG
ncbi:hypothetical protein [Brevundimonas sp.]|uniref:hypothetical protein n=1 Tax=Brevundimonas sp. TaxID=1871086 RepID=UPI002C217AF8|nr:hypothetical protein [Brevundimonas sp.]HWQ87950.1 hypothetical protein [Brevundimonas sp.]